MGSEGSAWRVLRHQGWGLVREQDTPGQARQPPKPGAISRQVTLVYEGSLMPCLSLGTSLIRAEGLLPWRKDRHGKSGSPLPASGFCPPHPLNKSLPLI